MSLSDAAQPRGAAIDPAIVAAFQEAGACCLRGLFVDWVDELRAGVAFNMENPGPYGSENTKPGEAGRFFDDYCNWQRIPQFRRFIEESPAAAVAAQAMGSRTAQFFHEHVLVKEPGTAKPTPWHQDMPYYCVEGGQTVSFWMPLDPVPRETSLQIIKGSHRWDRLVLPVKWLNDTSFYPDPGRYRPVPDPGRDGEDYEILSWTLEPGDAVLFSYKTVHGAAGNHTAQRRRAFSHRWVGDDARFVEREGRTSPPFPGIDQKHGERLREDWFPRLWPRA
ncbi:MAG TPA: phytanoyl-CoA dioxygenase family protein [Kiloniellaceae bacterium]|nr:phytanoyl-CoA dioxygenase family protein [Kiloniellaceae bacterium]